LRCPKSPFPVSRSAKASALACACECLQVPPYHSVPRQGTMPSDKRRKRLPTYFNFSDALLPHVAPIALERGAGAVTGQSGAAVSRSRQTRTAEQYRTDPTNAPDLHIPVGVPLSGGSDSDSEGGDDSDTSTLSDGVADWSGAEDMDFSSDEEQPAGGFSSRREFVCFG